MGLEEARLHGLDAHAGVGPRRMDELAVADVDAGVVAAVAAPKGDNVARAHLGEVPDGEADFLLLGGRAREPDAGAPIGPLHEARAVEAAGLDAAPHVGRTDGGVGATQHFAGHRRVVLLGPVPVAAQVGIAGVGLAETLVVGVAFFRLLPVGAAKRQNADEHKDQDFVCITHFDSTRGGRGSGKGARPASTKSYKQFTVC